MHKKAPLFLTLLLVLPAFANESRPNIIFFLSDDHRWDSLGCAGHRILKTPVLDKLAGEGVRFENMFVTTSICAASRASLFTGLYERTHRFTFRTPPVRKALFDQAYPTLLRKAGYRTGFTGKFGIGVEGGTKGSFDFFHPIGRGPYLKKQKDGSLRHETQLCGDRAIEFINDTDEKKPFCLSVCFNASHAEDGDKRPGIGHFPWPKVVDGLYDDIRIPPPLYSAPLVYESQPEYLKKSLNRQRFFWRWDTPEKFQVNMRAYYRMISGIDHVVGRVREELQELGLANNTILVFSGDNGYYMGQRGFAGKWSHYEESLRVPLIIYDPRAPRHLCGRTAPEMALNIDIPATILAYAGTQVPEGYQGRNLRPIMDGQSPRDWRTDTFCEHLMDYGAIPKWEGVRSQRYVYARYFEQDKDAEHLHDLVTDPAQLKNLVSKPEYKNVLAKMRKRTNELRDQLGGPYQPHQARKSKKQIKKK